LQGQVLAGRHVGALVVAGMLHTKKQFRRVNDHLPVKALR
jgi:hypothetical protein